MPCTKRHNLTGTDATTFLLIEYAAPPFPGKGQGNGVTAVQQVDFTTAQVSGFLGLEDLWGEIHILAMCA